MSHNKILLLIIFLVIPFVQTNAICAYPYAIQSKTKAGSSVTLRLRGCEKYKYAITEDGHTVVQGDDDNWCFLNIYNGETFVSNITLDDLFDDNLKKEILNIPRGLIFDDGSDSKPSIEHINNITNNSIPQPIYHNLPKGPITGTRKALVILMQYPDLKMKHGWDDFNNLFNQQNYNEHSASGSVYDYFKEVSEGQLDLTSTIIGPFTASHSMSYYGKNASAGGQDTNPFALFQEALEYANKNVNLLEYDCDGNGLIDNIHIIYAGFGEEAGASSNAIWAHECTFEPIQITEGLSIDRYSCSPELRNNSGNTITTIGPPCHEICHALGTMDFYDTNYTQNGEYCGTGNWDVMGSGSWNNYGATPAWPNPYTRCYDFGWTEPITLSEDESCSFDTSGKRLVFRIDTQNENEFFLLDHRDNESFSSFEPGKGMLIFHIGPDIKERMRNNTINASYPQQCYPVCASSRSTVPNKKSESYGDINSSGCVFPGSSNNSTFGSSSTPMAALISGEPCGFEIDDIHYSDDGILCFSYATSVQGTSPEEYAYWHEDFESSKCLESWVQEHTKGKANWVRESLIDESGNTNSVLSLMIDKEVLNPSKITTVLKAPAIQASYDIDSITHAVLGFSMKNSHSDICEVEAGLIINGKEIHSSLVQSDKKDWHDYITDFSLPESEEPYSIQITIKSTIPSNSKGILQMDDISLKFVRIDNAAIDMIQPSPMDNDLIFDLNGRRMNVGAFDDLPAGMYIVKKSTSVKKYIKH